MEREDHVAIADEMKRTGGHFVQALALAIVRADLENLARIKRAFPELWEKYKSRAAMRRMSSSAVMAVCGPGSTGSTEEEAEAKEEAARESYRTAGEPMPPKIKGHRQG